MRERTEWRPFLSRKYGAKGNRITVPVASSLLVIRVVRKIIENLFRFRQASKLEENSLWAFAHELLWHLPSRPEEIGNEQKCVRLIMRKHKSVTDNYSDFERLNSLRFLNGGDGHCVVAVVCECEYFASTCVNIWLIVSVMLQKAHRIQHYFNTISYLLPTSDSRNRQQA